MILDLERRSVLRAFGDDDDDDDGDDDDDDDDDDGDDLGSGEEECPEGFR